MDDERDEKASWETMQSRKSVDNPRPFCLILFLRSRDLLRSLSSFLVVSCSHDDVTWKRHQSAGICLEVSQSICALQSWFADWMSLIVQMEWREQAKPDEHHAVFLSLVPWSLVLPRRVRLTTYEYTHAGIVYMLKWNWINLQFKIIYIHLTLMTSMFYFIQSTFLISPENSKQHVWVIWV